MKTVVSVSQCSSDFDYEIANDFLGQNVRVIRLGADGALGRAEWLLE